MPMLGLKHDTVALSSHFNEWQQAFKVVKKELVAQLEPWALDIQHIGSTSIKCTLAKPIIDIGVLIANMGVFQQCQHALEQLSYHYRGDAGAFGGHVFIKNSTPDIRTHNLHLIEMRDPQWKNYILFRDYLNAHPEMAHAYSDLKRKLAEKFPAARRSYTLGKTEFVHRVLKLAAH